MVSHLYYHHKVESSHPSFSAFLFHLEHSSLSPEIKFINWLVIHRLVITVIFHKQDTLIAKTASVPMFYYLKSSNWYEPLGHESQNKVCHLDVLEASQPPYHVPQLCLDWLFNVYGRFRKGNSLVRMRHKVWMSSPITVQGFILLEFPDESFSIF